MRSVEEPTFYRASKTPDDIRPHFLPEYWGQPPLKIAEKKKKLSNDWGDVSSSSQPASIVDRQQSRAKKCCIRAASNCTSVFVVLPSRLFIASRQWLPDTISDVFSFTIERCSAKEDDCKQLWGEITYHRESFAAWNWNWFFFYFALILTHFSAAINVSYNLRWLTMSERLNWDGNYKERLFTVTKAMWNNQNFRFMLAQAHTKILTMRRVSYGFGWESASTPSMRIDCILWRRRESIFKRRLRHEQAQLVNSMIQQHAPAEKWEEFLESRHLLYPKNRNSPAIHISAEQKKNELQEHEAEREKEARKEKNFLRWLWRRIDGRARARKFIDLRHRELSIHSSGFTGFYYVSPEHFDYDYY